MKPVLSILSITIILSACVSGSARLTPQITQAITHQTKLVKVIEKSNVGYIEWADATKARILNDEDAIKIVFSNGLSGQIKAYKGTVLYAFKKDGAAQLVTLPYSGPENELQAYYYGIILKLAEKSGEELIPVKIYKSSEDILKDLRMQ